MNLQPNSAQGRVNSNRDEKWSVLSGRTILVQRVPAHLRIISSLSPRPIDQRGFQVGHVPHGSRCRTWTELMDVSSCLGLRRSAPLASIADLMGPARDAMRRKLSRLEPDDSPVLCPFLFLTMRNLHLDRPRSLLQRFLLAHPPLFVRLPLLSRPRGGNRRDARRRMSLLERRQHTSKARRQSSRSIAVMGAVFR